MICPLGTLHRRLEVPAGGRLDVHCCPRVNAGGRSARPMALSRPKSTALSITFCNSRTLPGQR